MYRRRFLLAFALTILTHVAWPQSDKLPVMHHDESVVKAGGFISYGSSSSDLWKRAAYYIDRLLKGAKPQDLPIEQEARVNYPAASGGAFKT